MLISVVVPVYRVENFIHRCVESLITQSFDDFELLLVDDGSSDNCGQICDEFAEKDSRIVVIHKKNGGLSDARDAGIDWSFRCSDSSWISFVDSDDWVHREYLKVLYGAVRETKCRISVCAYQETAGNTARVNCQQFKTGVLDTETFFCEKNVNAVVAWGKLYDKELLRDIRYPIGKLHEDEFVTYKLLFQCKKCAFIGEPLYNYYVNEMSITRREWSPNKLDVVTAVMESIMFFYKKGYRDAYACSINRAVWNIMNIQFPGVENYADKNGKKRTVLFLRKRLRWLLRRCEKIGLYPFSVYKSYYETAFPIEMKFYWYFQALKSKVKRK